MTLAKLHWVRCRLRRLGVTALAVFAVSAMCSAAHAQSASSIEDAVKATYLYKFVPFVQWNPGVFALPTSPVVLCIVASNGFVATLERAVSGQQADGRPFLVQHVASLSPTSACHIAFIAGQDSRALAQNLAAMRGHPVLTVTDGGQSAQQTGIINFVIQDNRIRFDIDLAAAAANNLQISSKLLGIAAAVKPDR